MTVAQREIRSIKAHGVLGEFSYDVEYPTTVGSDRMRLIYAPNGRGKTNFLQAVSAALTPTPESLQSLIEIPFARLAIAFANGGLISIERGDEAVGQFTASASAGTNEKTSSISVDPTEFGGRLYRRIWEVDELLLEVSLTSRRHIVVEGPSDDRFFRAWAKDIAGGERVVVTSVERIEVDPQSIIDNGLNDGNRSRLVVIARRAHEASIDLRCVADRDCGHHVHKHTYATLAWTDFPALESYALEASVLDRANLLSFSEKLPPASDLLPSLTFALAELFAVRLCNEHLPKPKYQAGFKNKDRSLTSFDVTAAVDVTIRSQVSSYPRPSIDLDPRTYAYGHDIAELLLAVYGNTLKNQAGLGNRDAVEGALRSAIQVVGTYKNEPLFRGLADWVAA